MSTLKKRAEPEAIKITGVADILGVSASSIRRLLDNDPDFPKPFKLHEKGDLVWMIDEVRTYLRRRAMNRLSKA